jgi:hypothetical protein
MDRASAIPRPAGAWCYERATRMQVGLHNISFSHDSPLMLLGEFVVVIAFYSDVGCEPYHIYVKILRLCIQGSQEFRWCLG